MTTPDRAQFALVGCSECDELFVVDQSWSHHTASCPTCGTTVTLDSRRRLYESDSHEEVVGVRARVLKDRAEQSRHVESFDIEGFDEMAVAVEKSLEGFIAEKAELARETTGAPSLDIPKVGQTDWREDVWATLADQGGLVEQAQAEQVQEALVEADAYGESTDAAAAAAGLDAEYLDWRAQAETDLTTQHEPEWPRDGELSLWFPSSSAQRPLGDMEMQRLGPRFSAWLPDYIETIVEHAREAVRELAADRGLDVDVRSQTTLANILLEDVGVTANNGEVAHALARYALLHDDPLDDLAAEERAELTDAQQREFVYRRAWNRRRLHDYLCGLATPGGAQTGSTDAVVDGLLAALSTADHQRTISVTFDAPAWETDAVSKATGQRAIDMLREFARVYDVVAVVTSTRLASALERFELGAVDVTRVLDAARRPRDGDDTNEDAAPAPRAVLDDIEPWKNGYGRLLLAMPDEGAVRQQTLAGDEPANLGESAVSQYLPVLADAGLVVWNRDERPHTVTLTSLGDSARVHVDPGDGSLQHPSQSSLSLDFTSPPHSDVGAVCRAAQGREGGNPTGAQSVEEWVAETADVDHPNDYVQWLWGPSARRDEYVAHARYAAPSQGVVTCVDGRIRELDDGRVTYLSEIDDEVLTLVQWGGPLATAARIAATLLSQKALSKLLRPERLGDDFEHLATGDGTLLDEFDQKLRDVLVQGMQIGWLSGDEEDYAEFRDRIGGVRADALERLAKVAGTEQWDERGELMNDLQGLITLATTLYRAAGYDLTINIRCPDTANIIRDEVRAKDFLDFWRYTVPKQAAYDSENGTLSLWRETVEDRVEKRKFRLSRADGDEMGAADATASWVLTGRTATDLRRDIEYAINRTEPYDQVERGEEAAPHFDVDVRNGNAVSSLKSVVRQFASLKGKRVGEANGRYHSPYAQSIERLARVATAATATNDRPHEGNPMALAEGMVLLGDAGDKEWLTVGDLEHAFAQMDSREFLPDLSPSATKMVQVLLEADDPLTRSAIVERAGVSTSSWERARATTASKQGPGDLRAAEILGIVQEATDEEHAFIGTLEPWWTTGSGREEPQESGAADTIEQARTERDLVFELSDALGIELPFDVFSFPADLERAYSEPGLHSWRAFLWAAVSMGDEFETGPPDIDAVRSTGVTRVGIASDGSEPTAVIDDGQLSLVESASPNAGLEKVADGGREGGQ